MAAVRCHHSPSLSHIHISHLHRLLSTFAADSCWGTLKISLWNVKNLRKKSNDENETKSSPAGKKTASGIASIFAEIKKERVEEERKKNVWRTQLLRSSRALHPYPSTATRTRHNSPHRIISFFLLLNSSVRRQIELRKVLTFEDSTQLLGGILHASSEISEAERRQKWREKVCHVLTISSIFFLHARSSLPIERKFVYSHCSQLIRRRQTTSSRRFSMRKTSMFTMKKPF